MVSLLIIGLFLPYDKKMVGELDRLGVNVTLKPEDQFFWIVIGVCVLALGWAIWQSKRDTRPDA